jgi:malonyl-CoA decarboxylase
MINVTFLQELMNTVAEQGRQLLPWPLRGTSSGDSIEQLAAALVSTRGEASGVVLARELLSRYRVANADERRSFYRFLAEAMQPDRTQAKLAAASFAKDPTDAALARLQATLESPRHEFFRRLNLAPGATAEIVAMRRDLLRQPKGDAALSAALAQVDTDLMHLLYSWFNRGFLVLRRIDWQTPAAILDKIIAYEAVHEIQGWDDLRRRLDPADRRCFAFFHPSLIDEPLIFVEVALMSAIPAGISDVLHEERKSVTAMPAPTTAVFYSISNCQEGLKGISFGNFLIKQVAEELAKEHPTLKTFVTLSPVPHFARWLDRVRADQAAGIVTAADRIALAGLNDPEWVDEAVVEETLKPSLMALAAHYFLVAKTADGRPVDPVARFHLGNGAKLERINWLGDASSKGLAEAHGLMVNYKYELKEIEANHEAYANDGTVAAARPVKALLRRDDKVRAAVEPKRLPAPVRKTAIAALTGDDD